MRANTTTSMFQICLISELTCGTFGEDLSEALSLLNWTDRDSRAQRRDHQDQPPDHPLHSLRKGQPSSCLPLGCSQLPTLVLCLVASSGRPGEVENGRLSSSLCLGGGPCDRGRHSSRSSSTVEAVGGESSCTVHVNSA